MVLRRHADRVAGPPPTFWPVRPAGPRRTPPFRTGNTFVFWFGKDGCWSRRGAGAATGGATRTFGFKDARVTRWLRTQSRTQKEHKRKARIEGVKCKIGPSFRPRRSRVGPHTRPPIPTAVCRPRRRTPADFWPVRPAGPRRTPPPSGPGTHLCSGLGRMGAGAAAAPVRPLAGQLVPSILRPPEARERLKHKVEHKRNTSGRPASKG